MEQQEIQVSQPVKGKYEITALGWLLIALVGVTIGFGAYTGSGSLIGMVSGKTSAHAADRQPARVTHAPVPAAVAKASATLGVAVAPADKDQVTASLRADLEQERKNHLVQAGASKAVADELQRRLAEFDGRLKSLVDRMAALPAASSQSARAAVVASAQEVQKSVNAAKAHAAIDLSSLPIDFVTSQSSGISGFDRDGIVVAGRKLGVGHKLQSGEAIVAIDAESRTVVTEKRILNVTN